MRIIKFRGKRIDNGEWVYGYFTVSAFCSEGTYWTIQPTPRISHKVERETVGQFTGLHDKNGKEIYEGDILEDTLGRKILVEYYKDGFWLNASLEGAEWCLRQVNSSSKIIGNIYENPELLTD